jgi:transcriptional regulator with XRE-family HTH domain
MSAPNKLRELREKAGKSQEHVVCDLEAQEGSRVVNRQMLSHYETGRHLPQGVPLDALCRYYGVTPAEVLPPGSVYLELRRVPEFPEDALALAG